MAEENGYRQLSFRAYARTGESIRMMSERIVGHHPAHTHEDFIEIVFVAAGRGEQTINGEQVPIAEGDLFLFNPHVVHSFTSDDNDPLLICNCLFLPNMAGLSDKNCRDFLGVAYHYLLHRLRSEEAPGKYLRLAGPTPGEIRRSFEEMTVEYERRADGYVQILKAELTKLLIRIFRLYRESCQKKDQQVLHRLLVRQTLSYLEEHAAEPVSCEHLARRAYLSVNYFRTIFQKITGKTVIAALQEIRVEQACRLLEETMLSVAAIAGRVGYSDVKFFYKVFREQMGETPGAWRRHRRANTVEMPPNFP